MKISYKVLSSQGVVYTVERTTTKLWGFSTKVEKLHLYTTASQYDSTGMARAINIETGRVIDQNVAELNNAFRAYTTSKQLQAGPYKNEYKILYSKDRVCLVERTAQYLTRSAEVEVLRLYLFGDCVTRGEFVSAIDTETGKFLGRFDGVSRLRIAYKAYSLSPHKQ